MDSKERDEQVQKFRDLKITTVITTNLLARGIDVPEIQLVINFDVPITTVGKQKKIVPDYENYLHRIGRAGRFGTKGIALNLYDREEDEKALKDIMEHFTMKEKLKKLESPDQLKKLLEEIREEAAQ